MKVKDLIDALDGFDPEALFVLNFDGGEQAWVVDSAGKGYVQYPPLRGHYCEYSVPEEWADEDEEESLAKAFIINAG